VTTPTAREIASALKGRQSGAGWSARCPAHDDRNPSLSIDEGDDGRPLVRCHTGCSQEAVIDALRSRGLWETPRNGDRQAPDTTVTEHPYHMADDSLLVTVMRREGPDGKKCGTPPIWRDPKGAKPPAKGYPPYRLGSLLANPDKPLLVVEGEKTALCAHDHFGDRYEATTAIGGAGKAAQTDWTPAHGRAVVGWPDAEKPDAENPHEAREHIEECARLCLAAGATSARIVDTSGFTPENGFAPGWDLADAIPDGFDIEAAVSNSVPLPYRREQNSNPSGFACMSMGELLSMNHEGVTWLVDDMLSAGGCSLLVAKPKAGKSTLARCLALAVARGDPWLGREVEQGLVVYVALEEQAGAVAEHFRAMGAAAEDSIVSHVGPAPLEPTNALSALVDGQHPALVIVDPVFRLLNVDDGNNYAEMMKALAPLVDMARSTGCHVMAVHHARKSRADPGDEALGSTALFGSFDCLLSMKRNDDDSRSLSTRQRAGQDMQETVLELDPCTQWISAGETKAAIARNSARTAIVEHLREVGEARTAGDIAEAIGQRKQSLTAALRTLTESRDIVRTGEGKRGSPYRYELHQ